VDENSADSDIGGGLLLIESSEKFASVALFQHRRGQMQRRDSKTV